MNLLVIKAFKSELQKIALLTTISGKSIGKGQSMEKDPSEDQKEAGNYKKIHVKRDGMDITIENSVGSYRVGKDKKTGKVLWKQKMVADYGYILGTLGYDKDHLDAFIKPGGKEDGTVYVVNQIDRKTRKFDEHKPMIGYDSISDARKGYLGNYEKGWDGLKSIIPMPIEEFKRWARSKGPQKGELKIKDINK